MENVIITVLTTSARDREVGGGGASQLDSTQSLNF